MLTGKHDKIIQLVKEMQKNLQSVEMAVYPEPLIKALTNVISYIEKDQLALELILVRHLDSAEAEKLSEFIWGRIDESLVSGLTGRNEKGSELPGQIDYSAGRVYLIDGLPVAQTERINPSCTLIYIDQPVADHQMFLLKLSRFVDHVPYLFFITAPGVSPGKELLDDLKKAGIYVIAKALPEQPEGMLTELAFCNNNESLKTNLTGYSAASFLENICAYFRMYIEQDLAEIQTRKMTFQQQAVVNQLQTSDRSAQGELIQNIKSQTQFQFADFEKGVKKHLDENFRTKTGAIWSATEKCLEELTSLDSQKKAKRHEFVIPKEFETEFLDKMHAGLYGHCVADISSMNDMYDAFNQKMDEEFKQSGLTVSPYYFRHLTDLSFMNMLESAVRIDRPYKSEAKRMGGYEYFMAIRKYQMIFFMMFSTFGLSFIRGMLEIMIPVTIVLLVVGGYFVLRSAKKEKEETAVKELDKAKESLMSEARRMFSEVQREWPSVVTEHQREQMQAYLLHTEKQIKETLLLRQSEQSDKKQMLSKQIQGIDLKEKKLVAAQENNNNLLRNVGQYKKDVILQIRAIADAKEM